jgi:hypothetical protein
MGGSCSTNGGEEECVKFFGEVDIGGWKILRWNLERYDGVG